MSRPPAAGSGLTPAMEQWRKVKDQHPDKILLFRMGDFYELFHEDAQIVSRDLGLVLTTRSKGENPVPMAGVPHHQLERYLKDLLAKGHKAVVCDQLEDPAQAKGVVKRGVTRVVTPGTVLEDSCLERSSHNFLAAACRAGARAGVAYADLSTGEFYVCSLAATELVDELERLGPAETLIPKGEGPASPAAELAGRPVGLVTGLDGYYFDALSAARALAEHFGVASLAGFGLEDSDPAVGAAGACLAYLAETSPGAVGNIFGLRKVDRSDCLLLDRATQRNLELFRSLSGDRRRGTLLGVLDRTCTGPGARLLQTWLLRPLRRLEPIRERQAAVAELMGDHLLRGELRELLQGLADLERIMARVVAGRATGRDLAALRRSAEILPGLAQAAAAVEAPLLARVTAQLDPLSDLAEAVGATLVDEPPAALREGGLIREGYNADLDELRQIARGGREWIARFQADEQAKSGIPSLKVGFNKVFGYYLEVTHVHRDKVPAHYERKQTLVNAERYVTPELKEYEAKVLGAQDKIVNLEYDLFCQVRDQVAAQAARVQAVAQALAELDVLAALAEGGALGGYCLPEVHEGLDTVVEDGRHPVVEALLPEGQFVANDLNFNAADARLLIITGPNMAGKSTYIRQVALLTILAHLGAPVPAKRARIGLVDQVFTRVGAADDLARGQSTFMVEMTETANILNNATERSLIVLDEVGRGTSTFDGVSLAWAISEFLHNQIKARTLFATHYHELAELGVILERAKNLNVAVRDWGGEIIFLRKIQPGSCDRSYGLQVAKLAGLPGGVIERSREILLGLEAQASERDWNYLHAGEVLRAAAREVQLDLFAPPKPNYDALAAELSALDLDQLSPREAHERLGRLVEQARGGRASKGNR